MPDTFEVFVIGPMGEDKDDPSEASTPISFHMKNIAIALNNVLPKFIEAPGRYDIFTPDRGGEEIEQFVFGHIDTADLAIADITARSPSVMYELSYFHALGTPVIIVDDRNRPVGTTPFYLRGANILRVSSFEVEDLQESLTERLRLFFEEGDVQDFRRNPITRFYSAPLVEVSGAAAIARGYYRNLVDPILNGGYGVINRLGDDVIRNLYVIRPTELTVGEDLARFGRATAHLNGGIPIGETSWSISYMNRSRDVSAYSVGGDVFDYPRTIGTLEASPRLERLGGVRAPRVEEARARIKSKLVDYFLRELDDLAYRNRGSIRYDRFKIVEMEDFEVMMRRIAPPSL